MELWKGCGSVKGCMEGEGGVWVWLLLGHRHAGHTRPCFHTCLEYVDCLFKTLRPMGWGH